MRLCANCGKPYDEERGECYCNFGSALVAPALIFPDDVDVDEMGNGDICVLPIEQDARTWIREFIRRQMEWSHRTFGPGHKTIGLSEHIRKELTEIAAAPHDLEEWIDVILLAIDGAWRCGATHDVTPEEIIDMLEQKQEKNFERTWEANSDPTKPNEHVREETSNG